MKKVLAFLFVTFIACNLHAQIANTKWKGTLNVQGGVNVSFNFKNDTLEVTSSESGESIETMKYNLADSVLTLQKLYGSSQCGDDAGKYKCVVTGNELTLTLISDSCDDRSTAIGTMKLEKQG